MQIKNVFLSAFLAGIAVFIPGSAGFSFPKEAPVWVCGDIAEVLMASKSMSSRRIVQRLQRCGDLTASLYIIDLPNQEVQIYPFSTKEKAESVATGLAEILSAQVRVEEKNGKHILFAKKRS